MGPIQYYARGDLINAEKKSWRNMTRPLISTDIKKTKANLQEYSSLRHKEDVTKTRLRRMVPLSYSTDTIHILLERKWFRLLKNYRVQRSFSTDNCISEINHFECNDCKIIGIRVFSIRNTLYRSKIVHKKGIEYKI